MALRPVKRARNGKRVRKPLSLAELRERRGVSLREIADRTLPLRHLEELERGDVSRWPVGVYAKSWARDYAREAGIDPDQVTAFVAPVADVDISTDDIRRARSLRERLIEGRAAFAIDAGTVTRIAAVAAAIALLLLFVILFLSRAT